MEEKLIEALDLIISWLESGGELVVEQAPIVVQEVLTWAIVGSILDWVLWTGGILAIVGVTHRLCITNIKNLPESTYTRFDQTDALVVNNITKIVATILIFITTAFNAGIIAKVTVAPRLYVIDYLRGIL